MARSNRIKAIETRYVGYCFRSRLEARWAVFLDAAGIPWRYEPEGYDLEGAWYLPDFWLPKHGIFLEIKPGMPSPRECLLASRLRQRGGHSVVILAGDCWPGEYLAHYSWPDEVVAHRRGRAYPGDGLSYGVEDGWRSDLLRCRRCDGLCYGETGKWQPEEGCYHAYGDLGLNTCGDHDRHGLPFEDRCYEAARSARFDGIEEPFR
jgi:hypothetical protein